MAKIDFGYNTYKRLSGSFEGIEPYNRRISCLNWDRR